MLKVKNISMQPPFKAIPNLVHKSVLLDSFLLLPYLLAAERTGMGQEPWLEGTPSSPCMLDGMAHKMAHRMVHWYTWVRYWMKGLGFQYDGYVCWDGALGWITGNGGWEWEYGVVLGKCDGTLWRISYLYIPLNRPTEVLSDYTQML